MTSLARRCSSIDHGHSCRPRRRRSSAASRPFFELTELSPLGRSRLALALLGPRLAADAATLDREDATPDMLPEGMTDRPDMADAEAAVDADVPPADVPPDVMTDVIPDDVRDGGTDVPATSLDITGTTLEAHSDWPHGDPEAETLALADSGAAAREVA